MIATFYLPPRIFLLSTKNGALRTTRSAVYERIKYTFEQNITSKVLASEECKKLPVHRASI